MTAAPPTTNAPPRGTPELAALVARTAGPQPWRKVFHACNALGVSALVVALDPPRVLILSVLAGVVALLVVGDLVRLRSEPVNELFFRVFAPLASPREARGVASSTWYAIGVLAAFALFPPTVAVSSVLVMGLADPAAAYVGRRFGKRALLGGTVEGTLAFLVVAALVLLARHPTPAALVSAALSTLAERRSWPLDDNLSVPLACGAGLLVGGWLT